MSDTTDLPTLYELRIHAGYPSQAAFAQHAGISEKTYAAIEQGKTRWPSPTTRKRLAYVLRISSTLLTHVLRGEQRPPKPRKVTYDAPC